MFNYAGFDTLCAKEKFDHKKNQQAHNLPIYSTSTFVYDSPEAAMQYFAGQRDEVMHIYSRWGNPTVLALEEKLAAIESFDSGTDATALYFSTGMAAISATLMTFAKNGDTILTQGNLYGTTTELIQSTLADQGVKSIFSDLTDLNKVEDFLKQGNIKVIYLESPANPTLSCIDIDAICKLAKQYNCTTLFDNTFNTAFVQQPLTMGVDYVLYSTTKFLNGHGSALGGAVISYHHEEMKKIWQRRKTLGHSSNAFEAWLTYNGLKTLPLRMKKHIRNAEDITKFLKAILALKR